MGVNVIKCWGGKNVSMLSEGYSDCKYTESSGIRAIVTLV